MARIRTLKPEALQHRKVGRLSPLARLLWIGMITQADDEGRLVADPGQLRVTVFPYDRMTDGRLSLLLEEIAATGLVRLYRVNGVPYADFPSWKDHQRVDHPAKSKLPEYRDSPNPREPSRALANIPGGSEGIGRDQGSEGNGGETPGGPGPASSSALSNALTAEQQFHDQLRTNPAYQGIDLERELARMDAWLSLPKNRHRKKTRAFVVNWLNRCDSPLTNGHDDRPIIPNAGALRRFVERGASEAP